MKTLLGLILTLAAFAAHAQNAQLPATSDKNQTESGADLPNGVNQVNKDPRDIIKMYPNPTSGGITIEGFVVNARSNYRICDATGREVMRGNLSEGKTAIDVSGLQNGMYLVTITGEHQTTVLRLVRE